MIKVWMLSMMFVMPDGRLDMVHIPTVGEAECVEAADMLLLATKMEEATCSQLSFNIRPSVQPRSRP